MTTTQKSSEVRELRHLALAMYAVAAMLVLIPPTEFAGQLGWTAQPRVLNWRTGSVGLLSGAVLTPTVGMLLAVITAAVFGHRRTTWVLGIVAGLSVALMLLIMGVFVLDVLQLRPNVVAAMRRSFMLAAVKALINFGLAAVALSAICISALRVGRRRRASHAERSRTPAQHVQVVQPAQ